MQNQQEYQKWIRTFYTGNLLVKGWNHRKKEILELLNDKQDKASLLLDALGEKIAAEWALENQDRKINNTDLLGWGDRMKKAATISSDEMIETLEKLLLEVDDKVSVNSK